MIQSIKCTIILKVKVLLVVIILNKFNPNSNKIYKFLKFTKVVKSLTKIHESC